MIASTNSKREIIDYLWEWAENSGDWSKLLVLKVINSECELSITEREDIFKHYLQSLNLVKGLPIIDFKKPKFIPTSKAIHLESLSDISGVNKLAKSQKIEFANNITVVFGENGSGKTGYSRILKSLGISYDPKREILSNIYGRHEKKSAIIKYKIDGEEKVHNWNDRDQDQNLTNISVFNTNCVSFSLSDRLLIVTPIGFHLFNLVVGELKELEKLAELKINSHPTTLSWSSVLNYGTPQFRFISNLSENSLEDLEIIASYTNAHTEELKKLETELQNSNFTTLSNYIRNQNLALIELGNLLKDIRISKSFLNQSILKRYNELNNEIEKLVQETDADINVLADSRNIPYYNSSQFQTFLKAADDYIRLLDAHFEAIDDKCIYCLQTLDRSSNELLTKYREFFASNAQERLKAAYVEKAKIVNHLTNLKLNLKVSLDTFGLDEGDKPIQPQEILKYNIVLNTLKTQMKADTLSGDAIFEMNYEKLEAILEEKRVEIETQIIKSQEDLNGLTAKENILKAKIFELKDRHLLSTKIDEIKMVQLNHKIVSLLDSRKNDFNSYSISKKTTEARKELVQSNFDKIFSEEVKYYRKSDLKIDLSFITDKGSSKVIQKIKTHSLLEILSEGEQKAIALAEFLTELELDNVKAPVIFDDPVNSLDHKILDEVARRLVKLSNKRQTIIFTHSILLFNSFLYLSKLPTNKDVFFSFYTTKKNFDLTGYISPAEEPINSVKAYITKINTLLNNLNTEADETEIIANGYGYLRSAIELFVEHEIFHGTVKRYQKNISLTQFIKVDGVLINQHKEILNEIFERACGFITGHSEPEEVHNEPKLEDLRSDFEQFKTIRNLFLV